MTSLPERLRQWAQHAEHDQLRRDCQEAAMLLDILQDEVDQFRRTYGDVDTPPSAEIARLRAVIAEVWRRAASLEAFEEDSVPFVVAAIPLDLR